MFKYLLVDRGAGGVTQPCHVRVEGRLVVRKCTYYACAPPDLARDALEQVVTPMLLRESTIGGPWTAASAMAYRATILNAPVR